MEHFRWMIRDKYQYNLFLDGLPAATLYTRPLDSDPKTEDANLDYDDGVFVGKRDDQEYFMYNHLQIKVREHKVQEGDEYRIVGFEVIPHSIKPGSDLSKILSFSDAKGCSVVGKDGNLARYPNGVTFSYSIERHLDENTDWAHRFDHYSTFVKYDVAMKQILISLGVMSLCTLVAASYVKKSVTRDFAILHSEATGGGS